MSVEERLNIIEKNLGLSRKRIYFFVVNDNQIGDTAYEREGIVYENFAIKSFSENRDIEPDSEEWKRLVSEAGFTPVKRDSDGYRQLVDKPYKSKIAMMFLIEDVEAY